MMARNRDWADEFTLLCETCGYSLDSLPTAGACPECGRSIASSLPSCRTGSAWQQRPGPRAWGATFWQFIAVPNRLYARLDVRPGAARWLTSINVLAAGVIVAIVPAARLAVGRDPFVAWSPRSGAFAGDARAWVIPMTVLVVCLGTAALLLFLTWVESVGLRFFHNRRGWRITRSISWGVCAHSSYGWVVGAALVALGWGLIDLDLILARSLRAPTVRSRIGDWAAAPATLAFFAGMILFEFRVYQGVRACRFANITGPTAPVAT